MNELFDSFQNDIQEVLAQLGIELTKNQLGKLFYVLVFLCTFLIFPTVRRIKRWRLKRINSLNKSSFYTANEIKRALDYFVQTKFQNTNPSEELEPYNTHAFSARKRLLPFFFQIFKKPERVEQKYYLILADSGMGKTTFMLNLYFRYKSKLFRKFDIRIFPLGHPDILIELGAVPDEEKSKTILLLDALDEDKEAVDNYIKRINTLMEVAQKFRFVIVSCRTQFFPMQSVEPTEISLPRFGGSGGYHEFKKVFLSPFSENDIKVYLFKRYPLWRIKRIIKAYNLVKVCPYLMVRPMLLSYVDDLLEGDFNLSSISDIYEKLIESWVDRETQRQKQSDRDRFKKALYEFSYEFSKILFNRFERSLPLSVHYSEIQGIPDFGLSSLELKSKSLLNRDKDGNYKFSHKSILEYFLAKRAYDDHFFLRKFNFQSFSFAKAVYLDLCKRNTRHSDYEVFTKDRIHQKVKPKSNDALVIQNLVGFRPSVIDLSGLKLTDDYLHFLKPATGLLVLSLKNNEITNPDIINDLKELIQLDLSYNKLEIFELTGFRNMEFLDLSHNKLKQAFIRMPKLREISFRENPLTTIEITKTEQNLEMIDLRGTNVPYSAELESGITVMRDSRIQEVVKLIEEKSKPRMSDSRTKTDININLTLNAFNGLLKSKDSLILHYFDSERHRKGTNYDLRHDYIDGYNKPHLLKVLNIGPMFLPYILDQDCQKFQSFLQRINNEVIVKELTSDQRFKVSFKMVDFLSFGIMDGCLSLILEYD